MMKRVLIFAVVFGLGTLVAPGVAQSVGVPSSTVEELDPVGNAEAHIECTPPIDCGCFVESFPWWIPPGPVHCHDA